MLRTGMGEVAAVTLGHAAVAGVFHLLPGGAGSVHEAHLPLTIVAFAMVLARAVRKQGFRDRFGSPQMLLWRTLGLGGYLMVEAAMVDGLGWHLLHDPWLALAPLGVVAAGAVTAVVATVGVALWNAWPRPLRKVLPTAAAGLVVAGVVDRMVAELWPGAVRGRAPPAAV